MASGFATITQGNKRLHFGTRSNNPLKKPVHWVQDFYSTSEETNIKGLNQIVFLYQLEIYLAINKVRISMKADTSTVDTEASPRLLNSERWWKQCEDMFLNYLIFQIGANEVPLSHIIRENDIPDHNTVHTDFVNKTIYCTPLGRKYLSAD